MVKGHRGTLWCMAPEQVALRLASLAAADKSGKPLDEDYETDGQSADMFSLGLVMYQFLTCRCPFPMLMTLEEFHQEVQHDYLHQLHRQAAAYRAWEVGSPASARVCSSIIIKPGQDSTMALRLQSSHSKLRSVYCLKGTQVQSSLICSLHV